ncbi:MAG: DUF2393 family protein [Candidatus Bathyarchaeia archaeon]
MKPITLLTVFLLAIFVASYFLQINAIAEKNDVALISHRGLLTDVYYMVFGEVKNNGEKPVEKVKIEIKFFDKNNNFLSSLNATTSLSVIPPKRRSPFIGYLLGENAKKVSNYSIENIFYIFAEAKPEKLVIIDYHYYNGSFWTHILNNSTGPNQKATNNILVAASLYLNETIVGVTAGYLNLPSPGLLWDVGTWDVGEGEPIVLDFGQLFLAEEIENATHLFVTAESPDFAAQEEITLILKEEPTNQNQFNYAWLIVVILILCVIVLLKFRRTKRRRGQFKKRKMVKD